jgi:hypothetical protein
MIATMAMMENTPPMTPPIGARGKSFLLLFKSFSPSLPEKVGHLRGREENKARSS